VTDGEDAQNLTAEIAAFVLGGMAKLELQGPFAGDTQPRGPKIGAWRRGNALGDENSVDLVVDLIGDRGFVIVIQHQSGTSGAWD